jgi:hypothetical protein
VLLKTVNMRVKDGEGDDPQQNLLVTKHTKLSAIESESKHCCLINSGNSTYTISKVRIWIITFQLGLSLLVWAGRGYKHSGWHCLICNVFQNYPVGTI